MEWTLVEAQSRLDELLTQAETEGPQVIRWHDQTFIVITQAAYAALTGDRLSFKQWLLTGPSFGNDLEAPPRHPSPMRDPGLTESP